MVPDLGNPRKLEKNAPSEKAADRGERSPQKGACPPRKASLILENGPAFQGYSFGWEAPVTGEVVFNTSMVGYPESLTDPSYVGQILTAAYPLVGNYGVPPDTQKDGVYDYYESEKIHVTGLIISSYSAGYSHWNAAKSLGEWLKEHKVPGIYGIDTRRLTKFLREQGAMNGKIVFDDPDEIPFDDPSQRNLVAEASCRDVIRYGSGKKHVVLVDCGVKHNIIRCFLTRDVRITRVPWDYDFNVLDYDGLFVSNGPGDPALCGAAIKNLQAAIQGSKPVFGICMGNQLLALAAGAKTYKLKYGHRSHNQPVQIYKTTKCFVTSQNHGYAVDTATLPDDWEPLFVNMNDQTNEGICHKTKPFFSAQFHPEASSGPTDTEFLFDRFMDAMKT
ncbi:MAG: glutamine-hydrolyzing carbamoyl-phosphate synthase small subunit [Synergistaceae bacterium]|jgi:carbamoyl-phosphate synthase small subunit|nr:glutamine-hydrolyzing carbamoyl-phosphate synthase small subunit [Synergistaceae bacterium]